MLEVDVTGQRHCTATGNEYNLARSAILPEGLYILLALISFFSFFLLGVKLAQYLLDRFSQSFHQIEGICVNFLDQVHIFRFPKGRCHGNLIMKAFFAR